MESLLQQPYLEKIFCPNYTFFKLSYNRNPRPVAQSHCMRWMQVTLKHYIDVHKYN